jgi:hypothetical protein
MDTTAAETAKALDWFLKRILVYPTKGRMTVMKAIEGDPENRLNIRVNTLAEWIAEYHKEMTPVQPPPTDGRKFRHGE